MKLVLATTERMGEKMIRTVVRARADFAIALMRACYNLKSFFHKAGIEAF